MCVSSGKGPSAAGMAVVTVRAGPRLHLAGAPSGEGERRGANHSVVLEVEIEVIGAGSRDGGEEADLGTWSCAVVAGCPVRVDGATAGVVAAQCHQVSVGTEIGLQVGDWLSVLAHGEGEHRVTTRRQVAVEGDLVAVDGRGAVIVFRWGRDEFARHREVGAQRERLSPGGS